MSIIQKIEAECDYDHPLVGHRYEIISYQRKPAGLDDEPIFSAQFRCKVCGHVTKKGCDDQL